MATYDKTKVDDAAFTPGTDSVYPMGATADETGTDSVDEGDVGAVRMTADRKLLTRVVGATDSNRLDVDSSGHAQVDIAASSVTVDVNTELPAAAALADNTANPTVPAVGSFDHLWDGATWDRAPGNSIQGAKVNLRDSSGVEIGTLGDPIRVDPTGDTIQPVSGTVTVVPGTGPTDLGKAEDSGHTSGDVGVMALAVRRDSGTALASPGNDYIPITTDQDGKTWVSGAIIDDAAFTPGTDRTIIGGAILDDVAPDSVDEGDGGALRMSARRELYTQIRDGMGGERGARVDADGRLAVSEMRELMFEADKVDVSGSVVEVEGRVAIRGPIEISNFPKPDPVVVIATSPAPIAPSADRLSFDSDQVDVSGSEVEVSGQVVVMPEQSLANSQTSFTVSTTAIRLAMVNSSRKSLLISNASTSILYIGNSSTVASSGNGLGLAVSPGGSYSDSGFGVNVGEVWGVYGAASSSPNVVVSDRS